jgi:hypothetical protein
MACQVLERVKSSEHWPIFQKRSAKKVLEIFPEYQHALVASPAFHELWAMTAHVEIKLGRYLMQRIYLLYLERSTLAVAVSGTVTSKLCIYENTNYCVL